MIAESRTRRLVILAVMVLLPVVSAGCMGFNYSPIRDIVSDICTPRVYVLV